MPQQSIWFVHWWSGMLSLFQSMLIMDEVPERLLLLQTKICAIFSSLKTTDSQSWLKHWHKPNHNSWPVRDRRLNNQWKVNAIESNRILSSIEVGRSRWKSGNAWFGMVMLMIAVVAGCSLIRIPVNVTTCHTPPKVFVIWSSSQIILTFVILRFVPLSLKLMITSKDTCSKSWKIEYWYSDSWGSFQCSAKCMITCSNREDFPQNINNGRSRKGAEVSTFPATVSISCILKESKEFTPNAQDRNPDEWRDC